MISYLFKKVHLAYEITRLQILSSKPPVVTILLSVYHSTWHWLLFFKVLNFIMFAKWQIFSKCTKHTSHLCICVLCMNIKSVKNNTKGRKLEIGNSSEDFCQRVDLEWLTGSWRPGHFVSIKTWFWYFETSMDYNNP